MSSGFQSPSMNGIEEFPASLLELVRRLVVADFKSERVEYFKATPGFQIVFGVGQGFELVVGRHHVFIEVDLALFTLAVGADFGEKAGPVEVDIGILLVAARKRA